VPRLLCYSLFFLGVVGIEIAIIGFQFSQQGQLLSMDIVYLLVTNAIAMMLFLFEGLQLRRKTNLEGEQKRE
jgi:ABC-type transport system involved in cytochrome c biogenesis permease subunit